MEGLKEFGLILIGMRRKKFSGKYLNQPLVKVLCPFKTLVKENQGISIKFGF